jgi:hypothetical protein
MTLESGTCFDKIWYAAGEPTWYYLPSPTDAKRMRDADVSLLLSARRPKVPPMDGAEAGRFKANLRAVATTILACRPKSRCRSMACQICRRAAARMCFTMFRKALADLQQEHPQNQLSFVTVIPRDAALARGELCSFDIRDAKARLNLAFQTPNLHNSQFFGVLEVSYEEVPYGRCHFQPHWHLIVSHEPNVFPTDELKWLFPGPRTVHTQAVRDVHVLSYMCKTTEKAFRWKGGESEYARNIDLPPPRRRECLMWHAGNAPFSTIVATGVQLELPDQSGPGSMSSTALLHPEANYEQIRSPIPNGPLLETQALPNSTGSGLLLKSALCPAQGHAEELPRGFDVSGEVHTKIEQLRAFLSQLETVSFPKVDRGGRSRRSAAGFRRRGHCLIRPQVFRAFLPASANKAQFLRFLVSQGLVVRERKSSILVERTHNGEDCYFYRIRRGRMRRWLDKFSRL